MSSSVPPPPAPPPPPLAGNRSWVKPVVFGLTAAYCVKKLSETSLSIGHDGIHVGHIDHSDDDIISIGHPVASVHVGHRGADIHVDHQDSNNIPWYKKMMETDRGGRVVNVVNSGGFNSISSSTMGDITVAVNQGNSGRILTMTDHGRSYVMETDKDGRVVKDQMLGDMKVNMTNSKGGNSKGGDEKHTVDGLHGKLMIKGNFEVTMVDGDKHVKLPHSFTLAEISIDRIHPIKRQ